MKSEQRSFLVNGIRSDTYFLLFAYLHFKKFQMTNAHIFCNKNRVFILIKHQQNEKYGTVACSSQFFNPYAIGPVHLHLHNKEEKNDRNKE